MSPSKISALRACEEKLEDTRNQLLDAWTLIKEGDVLFHRWERLTKGLISIKNYPPDDRILALDKVLAEVGLLHEQESGEQALAAPCREERRSEEATGGGIIR